MRKWLVGLLAAGLCASSAWATTDTLDRAFTGVEAKATYVEWSGKTGDSGAVYAGQSAGDKDSIQLRSNNNNSGIVTTGSGGTATKVTVVWNENTAADREVSVYGKADAYSAATDLYSKDAQGTLIGSIKKGESTELSLGDGYEFIGLRSKSGALYLDSVAIEWDGGSAEFSVTFDKENWFEVEQGTASSVTAIAKHGVEPYTYEWSCDKSELLTGSEATLAIPDTLEADEYTLACLVTDAELNSINALIGLKVVEPKAKFAIECAVGIPNGSVSADKTEATEGETVTLTASPAAGYKLGTFLVNDAEIEGNTFTMPAESVLVSATFVEVTGETYVRVESADDFEVGADYLVVAYSEGKFSSALKNEASTTRLALEEVVINEDNTIVTDSDAIVWTIQAGAEEGQYVLYNAAKGVYAAATKDDNVAQLLEDGTAALAQWTLKFDAVPTVGIWSVSYPERWLSRNSTAGNVYFAAYKGTQTAPYLFKKAGPASFTVTLDKADGFTVAEGSADSITATAKNGSGDYSYAWTGDLTGDAATLEIPATLAAGTYTVKVTATDNGADAQTAEKEISFSVVAPAAKYQIQVAIGIPNGSVSADKTEAEEGETVTLTATPDAGYKLEHFLVNDIAISANTFPMPAEDVLVSASFVEVTGETYVRVESAADFEEGADYLVVAYSAGKFSSALKNEASTTRLALEEVVINEDNTIVTDSDAIVWTIQAGAEEGQYVLYNAAKGVYAAATKDDNVAQLLEDGTAALAQWTLKFDAVPTVGIWSVSYPERWLSRNSTAGNVYFAAYKGTQTAPYLFKKAGPASFTVTLDKADGFTVAEGSADSITATAKNGSGDYSYAWTGDLTGDAATLEIPATLAAGTYTVKVTATDNGADAQTAEKEISFSVVAPAAKYQIQVAIGIPNGSVSADKTEAEEGETVTLTATPDAGYKLEHFLVNDIAISANTFPMPAEDVLVSASFVEITGETYVRVESADDFEEGAEYLIVAVHAKGNFTSALKNEANGTRIGVEEVVVNEDNTIVTDLDSIVWTIQAGAEEGQYVLYNAAKGVYAAATKDDNVAQLLEDGSADLAQWTLNFDSVPTVGIYSVSYPERWLSRNSTAASAYFATYKGTQTAPYLFKKAGPSAPKVVYNGETTIELGESFELNFELKNYDGTSEWELAGEGSIADDGLYTWTPGAVGTYTIKVSAVNGEELIADSGDITLTVTEPGPQPGEPAIQFAVITDPCVVGQPVNFQVWAINLRDNTVYGNGFTGADGSSLSDNDITYDFPDVSFVPDVAGVYKFDFIAGEQDEEISDSIEITVTDGPGPQPGGFQITGLSATGGNLVLTFAGEGTPAVLGTASLATPQEWTPVEGASVSGTTATVPMGAQNYIRLQ